MYWDGDDTREYVRQTDSLPKSRFNETSHVKMIRQTALEKDTQLVAPATKCTLDPHTYMIQIHMHNE